MLYFWDGAKTVRLPAGITVRLQPGISFIFTPESLSRSPRNPFRLRPESAQRPRDRFQPAALKPLPVIPYDYRDHIELLVHKDLRLRFDGNRYCVPHRYVGWHLIVKADSSCDHL